MRGVMAGIHTTQGLAAALQGLGNPDAPGALLHAVLKANAVVKYGKTVLSVQTHFRNFFGNYGFAVANGHMNWFLLPDGDAMHKAVMTTVTHQFKLSNDQWIDHYKRLQRLGVVGESTRAGELRDIMRDATTRFEGFSADRGTMKLKQINDFAIEMYGSEDDFWKVYAFEMERARYKDALPGLSDTLVTPKRLGQMQPDVGRLWVCVDSMAP